LKVLGEGSAVIVFSVTSTHEESELVSISLIGDFLVNDNEGPLCVGFHDDTGFSVLESDFNLTFFVRNGARLNANTYWYGSSDDLRDNIWRNASSRIAGGSRTSASITWQNQNVSVAHPVVLWAVVALEPPSTPPRITVTHDGGSEWPIDQAITLRVNASDAHQNSVLIYLFIDGNVGPDSYIASVETGSPREVIVSSAKERKIGVGSHTLVCYGIDLTGGISDPSDPIEVQVTAPDRSRSPSASVSHTPSPSETVSSSRSSSFSRSPSGSQSPSPSQSPSHTPSPSLTPSASPTLYPSLSMGSYWGSSDVGVFGEFGFSSVAYCTFVANSSLNDIQVSSTVDGGAAVVVVRVINSHRSPELANITVYSSYLSLGTSDLATCSVLPTLNGIKVVASYAEMQVFCQNHGLVVDTDSYWFGPTSALESNRYAQVDPDAVSSPTDRAGLVFSWHNRPIPARGESFFSFVVRWRDDSTPPEVMIEDGVLPREIYITDWFNVTGTVFDSDGDRISVYMFVNRNMMVRWPVCSQLRSGTLFNSPFRGSNIGFVAGVNTLEFYAIDSTGTISLRCETVFTDCNARNCNAPSVWFANVD
jgi:hypothetical protein